MPYSSALLPAPSAPPVSPALRARPEDEMDLLELLSILKRHSRLIIVCTIVCACLALLHAFTARKIYTATATIEINQQTNHELGLADLSGTVAELTTPEMMTTDLLTQESEIGSETVALDVIQRLRLTDFYPYSIPADTSKDSPLYAERSLPITDAPFQRERVLKLFSDNLKVAIVKGTRLLSVSYADLDPNRATLVANAVVASYIGQSAASRFEASSQVSSFLTNQLGMLKRNVESSQKKVEEYQSQTGLVGTTTTAQQTKDEAPSSPSVSIPVARLLQLNEDLTNAEVSRISKEAIYRMTQTKDPEAILGIASSSLATGPGADTSFAASGSGLAILQELREQQAQLTIRIANAQATYGSKSATMMDLRSLYAATEAQIQAELARINDRARNDLDLARLAENGLKSRVALQEASVTEWSTKADHLLLLEGEASSSRQLYQDLFAKLQEANLAGGIKASRVSIVTRALVPAEPSFPKKRIELALGLFVGCIFGIIGAFALDYLDDKIHDKHEAQRALKGSLLLTVPFITKKQARNHTPPWIEKDASDDSITALLSLPDVESAEAYRKVRTALLANHSDSSPLMVAVTSGSEAEGKALTCFNLSVSFALLGHRVLLIDADMRRASNDALPGAGLGELLVKRLQPRDVIKASPELPSLFILPSGKNPPNPAELLSSKDFADLLETLKSEYAYIFIDTPPALRFTDATLLARMAGTFVVVARAGVTRGKELHETLDVLSQPEASLIGVVLNTSNNKPGWSAQAAGY